MAGDGSHDQEEFAIKGIEAAETQQAIEAKLDEYRAHLNAMPASASVLDRCRVQLDVGEALLGLERREEAWGTVRPVLDQLVAEKAWQEVVEACDVLYQTELDDAVVALAHGVWFGVTYPIKAGTTIAMLSHVVDETPENSDGAAVAAMVAHYIADVRAEDSQKESLKFLTTQIIAKVAKRHRGIEDQATLNTWIQMYELNNVEKLFPRLAIIVDTIVGNNWWYDRDALRAQLPVN